MPILGSGQLHKLHTTLASPVVYEMPLGDGYVPMNPQLGQRITLRYLGEISCLHCGRKTKKSFNQGYCYPCFSTLAQCDSCIMSPEKCHYEAGTCREPDWAETHCLQPHIVYLANSSGIKVGITRGTQVPTRWIDQGAIQALPIYRVTSRHLSGLVEMVFKQHIADKTNWRAMLKGEVDRLDLVRQRDVLIAKVAGDITALQQRFGLQAISAIDDAEPLAIDYPVLEFPAKVASLNFDKQALVEGTLMGIKGQYLILDSGVINIRKFGAYHIELGGQ